jgi:Domain of unknown function (DUF397)
MLTMVELSCLSQRRDRTSCQVGGIVGQESAGGEPTWHRPCESGACLEIAVQDEAVMLRSSVAPQSRIILTHAEWQEFLAGAKRGLFDRL